jgi:hypothetical protein
MRSLSRAVGVLAAFLLCAGFDSGGCDDEGEAQPFERDDAFDADDLTVGVKVAMQPRVHVSVGLSEASPGGGGREVVISSSRFLLDGVALRGDEGFGAYLDDASAGATLTYVDVDGGSHEIAIPPVPDTFLVVPEAAPYDAPLEVAWDGAPRALDEDELVEDRVDVTLVGEGEQVGHFAEEGATSVAFPASELARFLPGPSVVIVELVRETTTYAYPGTNGGFLSVRQLAPSVETTLE